MIQPWITAAALQYADMREAGIESDGAQARRHGLSGDDPFIPHLVPGGTGAFLGKHFDTDIVLIGHGSSFFYSFDKKM
jgi:hypothetical protein